jgi:hypothetical protein
MKRAWTIVALLVLSLCGCGGEKTAGTTTPPSPEERASQPPKDESKRYTTAPVTVVDLQGRPLANMLPIATKTPNAFREPVVEGTLTNDSGTSVLSLPRGQHLYVRAWDPSLRMFPNNFYEVLPPTGDSTEAMTITMVEGARLTMTLLNAAQQPAANENVGLMMFHPVHGPWWPDEGDTDAKGQVIFDSVPPGEYTIKVRALESGQLEVGSVRLRPGGETDIGSIVLQ